MTGISSFNADKDCWPSPVSKLCRSAVRSIFGVETLESWLVVLDQVKNSSKLWKLFIQETLENRMHIAESDAAMQTRVAICGSKTSKTLLLSIE